MHVPSKLQGIQVMHDKTFMPTKTTMYQKHKSVAAAAAAVAQSKYNPKMTCVTY